MPRGGIREKINNIGRGPRERCRSVPLPLFYLRHFFRAGLSIVPRSLLLNRTETLATRAMADRESSVAQCHGVALKKKKGKKNDRSWTEREVYRYPSIRYK